MSSMCNVVMTMFALACVQQYLYAPHTFGPASKVTSADARAYPHSYERFRWTEMVASP